MKLLKKWLVAVMAAFSINSARAASVDTLFDSSNDYGDVGLLQTPTARVRPDGQFGLGVSSVNPYNQAHFFLQLTPWLETTLRYTSVTDEPYSPDLSFSRENYKDRSADFKVKFWDEGKYLPAVALGVQDLGGTGLFSSEYLVSSYHFYDLDFSLGLGWGRLGARGGIHNPFTIFGKHFSEDRKLQASGQLGLSSLFTGEQISPFGGIQWRTPVKNVFLKLEYEGNDYQHEAFSNNFRVSNPINAALEYRPWKGVDLGVGYERGNTLMMTANFSLSFQDFKGLPKLSDPSPTRMPTADEQPAQKPSAQAEPMTQEAPRGADAATVKPDAAHSSGTEAQPLAGFAPSQASSDPASRISTTPRPPIVDENPQFFLATKEELNRQGLGFAALTEVEETHEVIVWVSQGRYRSMAEAIDRVARVLCANAPPDVKTFTIVTMNAGVETSRTTVPRKDFEQVARAEEEPDQLLENITLSGPKRDGEIYSATVIDDTRIPAFSWGMGPALRQSIGGPNSFYFAQAWWRSDAELALTDHLSLSGTAGLNIYNNFDGITLQSNSTLPHVRSDIADYLKKGQNNIVSLETDYIFSPLSQVYARFSGGIFEEMYGGVAAEALWRPYGSPISIGVDVNYLKQCDYNQLFDFRHYTVATGFLDLYYQLPIYDVLARVSVGRYLARDKGATLDLSREFRNGVRAGAFATKTNVSAAQFGEGSFDKGVYIAIPLDLFFTNSSRTYSGQTFRPTVRDGGQRAADGKQLFGITDGDSPRDFANSWPNVAH